MPLEFLYQEKSRGRNYIQQQRQMGNFMSIIRSSFIQNTDSKSEQRENFHCLFHYVNACNEGLAASRQIVGTQSGSPLWVIQWTQRPKDLSLLPPVVHISPKFQLETQVQFQPIYYNVGHKCLKRHLNCSSRSPFIRKSLGNTVW